MLRGGAAWSPVKTRVRMVFYRNMQAIKTNSLGIYTAKRLLSDVDDVEDSHH